jgi:UPF0716 protein FxsA
VLAGVLLLPVLELAVAVEVGRTVGAGRTVLLLLAMAVAGGLLVRRQGAAAWRALNAAVRAGEPPSRDVADATVLVVAGVLLILPGFLSDLAALLLILPPTRPLLRRPLERSLRRAAADRVTLIQAARERNLGRGSRFGPPSAGAPPRFGGDVVPGEIIDEPGDSPPGGPGRA